MDHSLEDSFFHHITSAMVIVDVNGNCQQGSPKGRQNLARLQISATSIQDQKPLCLKQVLASSLNLNLSASLAAGDNVVQLSSLGTASGLALVEWLPLLPSDTKASAGQEKLKILQEVSQAVNSSLIMEDIFDALGLVLQSHIPYQEAVIVILDDSQNGIKTLVRIFEDGDLEISGEHNAFAGYEPLVHHILRQPVSQLYQKNELPQSLLLADNAASALVVPLINKGVIIGLIALSTIQEQGFNQSQEELLTEVSAQLAVAVENAKFYWQTQSQASREFLINQLTRSIRQSLDTDIILGTAVTELGKVIGISRCFIRYFSPEGQEKTFQYQMPGAPPMNRELDREFHFSEGAVFNLRKDQPYNPFILNDVRDCPPQIAPLDYFEGSGIKSIAIVPILIRDELVGTITLHQCDAYRSWVMEDIELLKALAEHLGVALHQAQLFLALDQRTKALEQTLEELQQAQLYLVQSEKMAVLGQFVAGIAHEVNTPLGTMISNNATLIVCLDKLRQLETSGNQPGQTQLFESMDSLLSLNKLAASRIQDIVKNLRNFARLDESELKTVDLRDGIESTILLVQSSLPTNIELVRRYGPNVPEVQCYPGLLNQVFMNLIINASHAIQDKAENSTSETPLNTITIETSYNESSQLVTVAVRDTGKGIPKDNLTKVFDPGFTTKGAGVGTGLGLALCYRIVEKHQGRIYLHSVVNEGTSFFVEIPSHPRK